MNEQGTQASKRGATLFRATLAVFFVAMAVELVLLTLQNRELKATVAELQQGAARAERQRECGRTRDGVSEKLSTSCSGHGARHLGSLAIPKPSVNAQSAFTIGSGGHRENLVGRLSKLSGSSAVGPALAERDRRAG